MAGKRPMRAIADPDQWARCAHFDTALSAEGVALTWSDAEAPAGDQPPVMASGLAFDRWCRAYRSRPERGLLEASTSDSAGDPIRGPAGLLRPTGLAIDEAQRLYVAESGARMVHVIDLWAQRLLRKVAVGTGRQQPVDCAARCCDAVVLLSPPYGLVGVRGRAGPRAVEMRRPGCAKRMKPVRVAAFGSRILILWADPTSTERVIADPSGETVGFFSGATDLELTGSDRLVVARRPGQSFLSRRHRAGIWIDTEPLAAPGYDGGAIARSPDGEIAYTTDTGWSWTAGSAAVHAESGRLVSYRLDGGDYGLRWGRVFIDACLPRGSSLRLSCLTSDDDSVEDSLSPQLPDRGAYAVRHPEATPVLPSVSLLAALEAHPVHRRQEGREWPWAQIAADDDFETYEAPVAAPPGRFLWLVLDLTGTVRVSPRVRAIRVEAPGHRLLSQLPRSFSRDPGQASFLHRYLAPAEGLLDDLDARAALRAVLVDPSSTPQEALAWLASFVGLVLDRRWSEPARRQLVAHAVDLFRIRGTARCLEALLALYLGRRVTVVDDWQSRGLAGGILGLPAAGPPPPAVGGGVRVGGQLGHFTIGGLKQTESGYSATAHRFTVLIPTTLDTERRTVVREILAQHKPAHTMMKICELGDGVRVGRASRLDLTMVVGRGAAWGPATVGQVLVGGDGVIGQPSVGSRVGSASIASGLRVG